MHPSSQPSTASLRAVAYRVLVGGAIIIGLLLLMLILWYAVDALLLTFAGVLLAVMLRAPSDWLARTARIPETLAATIVLLAVVLLLVGLGLLVAPQIGEQARLFAERLPEAVDQARTWLQRSELGRLLVEALPTADDLRTRGLLRPLWQVTGVAYTALQVFLGVVILVFVGAFLSFQPRLYIDGVLHLVPYTQRAHAAELMRDVGFTLRRWLFGSVIRMAGVGVLTFAGLRILEIPLAFLLAFLAFLLDFVPYFGPVVAAVPAIMLAFIVGPQEALYVLILYVGVQQVESLILSPVVYQRTVYLPPVLTILAQILLFAMAGALGAALATPLMAVALVLVRKLYVETTLGDYETMPPEEEDAAHTQPPENDGS